MSYVSVKGLGDAVASCPDGTHQVCMIARPGDTAPAACSCRPDVPINAALVAASATSATNHHWGLIAGVAVAAFVVYKVATR